MKVLCINGDFSNAGERSKYLMSLPKEMEEYTIREILEIGTKKGYLLEEVFGGILPSGLELSFDSSRFVHLEEINTSEESIQEECLINFQ